MLACPNPVTGLLMSGGLDSSILLGSLLEKGQTVQPFYVRTRVAWEEAELSGAKRFLAECSSPTLRPLVVLDMPLDDVYGTHWSMTGRGVPGSETPDEAVFLPGRNAILLIKAAVWCQLHRVSTLALATLGTSPFADAGEEFMSRFQGMINSGAAHPIELVRPFAEMNKRQVMELGRTLPLQHTFSCISPVGLLHCGRCNKCAERREAFRVAGMKDGTQYADALGIKADTIPLIVVK